MDQLLHTSGSCDASHQVAPFLPEPEICQEQLHSPEEPPNQPAAVDTVLRTPEPTQVSTPGIVSSPGPIQFTPKDIVTDLPTGCVYPRRNRRPPDKLTL